MKKIIFIVIAVIFIAFAGKSQGLTGAYINFADSNFLNALIKVGVDKDNNGKIDTIEANNTTFLKIWKNNIKNLTGIEYFKNLDTLLCSTNELTNLDLKNNSKISVLYCDENKLTSLDLTNNINLTKVACYDNQISNINVVNCIKLKELICEFNKLTSLDVTKNINLDILSCGTNLLNSLDLRYCSKLTQLFLLNNANLIDVCVWTLPFPTNSLTGFDDSGCSLNLKYDTTCLFTKINEPIQEPNTLNIFPNPAKDVINISEKLKVESYKIYNTLGECVSVSPLERGVGVCKISTANLPKGIYIIECTMSNQIIRNKFIKE